MVVSVNFHGYQRDVTRQEKIKVSLCKGEKVNDVLLYIKTRYPDLPMGKESLLITVNNEISSLDKKLKENDKVAFIPHVGGG